MHTEQILIKPMLTEKSSVTTEEQNRYVFQVKLKSNKNQIKTAVEKMFNVKVVGVNTSILPGKVRRTGKSTKKAGSTKKAYIQIQEGQKLELFKGI